MVAGDNVRLSGFNSNVAVGFQGLDSAKLACLLFNQLLQNCSHLVLKMLKFVKVPTRSTTEDYGNPYRK